MFSAQGLENLPQTLRLSLSDKFDDDDDDEALTSTPAFSQEVEARQKERENFENRVRQRLSMQRAYRDAMETKIAKDNAEREEEEEMRKIMMAKFAGEGHACVRAFIGIQKRTGRREARTVLCEQNL